MRRMQIMIEDKIKEFFDSIKCPAIKILKTDRAGEIVENNYGVEFSLNEYAVIHKNNLIFNREKYIKFIDFGDKENIDIIHFEKKKIANSKNFMNQLSQDGYKTVWSQK